MIERYAGRILVLCLGSQLFSPFSFGQSPARLVESPPSSAPKSTNLVIQPVSPGPLDGPIAMVTARMLERFQYLRQPFNDAGSSKFLDRYIETFDPQHLHFLQSDLA